MTGLARVNARLAAGVGPSKGGWAQGAGGSPKGPQALREPQAPRDRETQALGGPQAHPGPGGAPVTGGPQGGSPTSPRGPLGRRPVAGRPSRGPQGEPQEEPQGEPQGGPQGEPSAPERTPVVPAGLPTVGAFRASRGPVSHETPEQVQAREEAAEAEAKAAAKEAHIAKMAALWQKEQARVRREWKVKEKARVAATAAPGGETAVGYGLSQEPASQKEARLQRLAREDEEALALRRRTMQALRDDLEKVRVVVGPSPLAPKALALAWLQGRGPATAWEVAEAVGREQLPLHAAIYAVTGAQVDAARTRLAAYRRAVGEARDAAIAEAEAITQAKAYEAWPLWLQVVLGPHPTTAFQRAQRLKAKLWLPWDGRGSYDPAISIPWRPEGAAAWAVGSPQAYDRTVQLVNAYLQKFVDPTGYRAERYRVNPTPDRPRVGGTRRQPWADPAAQTAGRLPLAYVTSFLPTHPPGAPSPTGPSGPTSRPPGEGGGKGSFASMAPLPRLFTPTRTFLLDEEDDVEDDVEDAREAAREADAPGEAEGDGSLGRGGADVASGTQRPPEAGAAPAAPAAGEAEGLGTETAPTEAPTEATEAAGTDGGEGGGGGGGGGGGETGR